MKKETSKERMNRRRASIRRAQAEFYLLDQRYQDALIFEFQRAEDEAKHIVNYRRPG